MDICEVIYVAKNEAWLHKQHRYLVQTKDINQAERTAKARLMIDEPEHYERFKPAFNFREMF